MLKLGGEEAEGGERIAKEVPGNAARRTRAVGSVAVGEWSDDELDELIEQAVVDAYGDDEQRSGFLPRDVREALARNSCRRVLIWRAKPAGG
jgi:hypothetical protein